MPKQPKLPSNARRPLFHPGSPRYPPMKNKEFAHQFPYKTGRVVVEAAIHPDYHIMIRYYDALPKNPGKKVEKGPALLKSFGCYDMHHAKEVLKKEFGIDLK